MNALFDEKTKNEVLKYQVFPDNGRFVIGQMVYGTRGTTFTIVDDCRTEAFANARCAALNSGKVK